METAFWTFIQKHLGETVTFVLISIAIIVFLFFNLPKWIDERKERIKRKREGKRTKVKGNDPLTKSMDKGR